ncbi:MAG: hypothetical protein DRQ55_01795 [Planctomycetota bacterium]|nr:MAG: hypothetical protein DRQ55_01795 [Planctomycetota bacterium]
MSGWFSKKNDPPPEPPAPPPGDDQAHFGETTQTSYITGDRDLDTHRVRLLIDSLATVTSESQLAPAALLALMVDRAIESVGAERGLLFSRSETGRPVLVVARTLQRGAGAKEGQDVAPKGLSFSSECVLRVLEGGDGEYRSGNDSADFDPSQSMIQLDIRSLICVPLDMQAEGRGVLYVDARASERPFARADLRYFQAFANMLEIVWRQRQAVAERLSAERMKRDLELAREIQAGLLPDESVSTGGYRICGRVVPAEEAGGDYYDYYPTQGGRVAVAVGDVSGHGAGPALIMAGARAYMRSACRNESSPGAVLEQLNGHLVVDTDDDKFMSMFLGVLDLALHGFRWSNAGHPAPIVLRADGSHQELKRTGMALGVADEGGFDEGEAVAIQPGDAIVLFSDGIVELRAGGDEQYGTERLIESLRRVAGQPAEDLLEAVFTDAFAWAGSEHPAQDDLTVAVLRRDP